VAVPAYRSSSVTNASASSYTLTKPTGLAVGDFMVIASESNAATGDGTAPTGWTPQGSIQNPAGTQHFEVWTKLADSTDVAGTSFTVTYSSAVNRALSLYAISGASQTAPVNKITSATIAAGTSHAAPSVTPDVAETLIVCCFGAAVANATASSSALTNLATTQRNAVSETIGSTTGPNAGVASGTKTVTWSASGDGVAFTLAIAPPPPPFIVEAGMIPMSGA